MTCTSIRIPMLALAAASMASAPVAASAQSEPGPSFDAVISIRTGEGGHYVNRDGFGLELTGAFPLRETSAGTLVGELTTGVEGSFWGGWHCVRHPDGYCRSTFPGMIYVGALWGIERGSSSSGSARALAGPFYYSMDLLGLKGVGLQGRIDLATRTRGRLAFVASLRQAVLPSVEGDVVGITSLGAGVRIHP
jgi:hypothetical protein